MSFEAMSDQAIAAEIGRRIERIRLERNITQQYLADEVGVTRKTYRQLIQGQGKFINMIAVLRAMGALDLLTNFIPTTDFSPMERLKLEGRRRRRARGSNTANTVGGAVGDVVAEVGIEGETSTEGDTNTNVGANGNNSGDGLDW